MTASHPRDQIWYGILSAERLDRYYDVMATRFRQRHRSLNIFIAICSTGAAAVLLAELPMWISSILFLLVTSGVIWGSYTDYSQKSTIAFVTSKRCREPQCCLETALA